MSMIKEDIQKFEGVGIDIISIREKTKIKQMIEEECKNMRLKIMDGKYFPKYK